MGSPSELFRVEVYRHLESRLSERYQVIAGRSESLKNLIFDGCARMERLCTSPRFHSVWHHAPPEFSKLEPRILECLLIGQSDCSTRGA